jgi:hypothetical protein
MAKRKRVPIEPVSVHSEIQRQALATIARWKFASDGRKFGGNHKLVIREMAEIAEIALKQTGFGFLLKQSGRERHES